MRRAASESANGCTILDNDPARAIMAIVEAFQTVPGIERGPFRDAVVHELGVSTKSGRRHHVHAARFATSTCSIRRING